MGSSREVAISVVISTYNRCDMLPRALESVLAQEDGGLCYEVIVVDNNSTDRTRDVAESFIKGGYANLRYVFETKQGLSYARNAGIRAAQAPIIAFTDDDVRATPRWIAEIKRTFDEHPEIVYIGGKVLPLWRDEPPAWLTRDHWSPLALMDDGDEPFYMSAKKPRCMVGANLSVRREVFDRVGLFTPDLQRVKDGIGSTEDHEFQLRIWRAGEKGMYIPSAVVSADVQPERLTKAYHRRWHSGHGKYCALMQLDEQLTQDNQIPEHPLVYITLFGTPASLYRDLLAQSGHWVTAVLRGRKSAAFANENALRRRINYIRKRYQMNRQESPRRPLSEIVFFLGNLGRKKAANFFSKKSGPPS